VLRPAEHNTGGDQVVTHRLVAHPDTGLLSQVIGQALTGPQRVGLVQATWPLAGDKGQFRLVFVGYRRRGTRMGRIAQAIDALSQVALEPAPHRLFIGAHDFGDVRSHHVLLGCQQDHLRPGMQSQVVSCAIQMRQLLNRFG
jgi:hypothetical protein